jgi:hypothetical protein
MPCLRKASNAPGAEEKLNSHNPVFLETCKLWEQGINCSHEDAVRYQAVRYIVQILGVKGYAIDRTEKHGVVEVTVYPKVDLEQFI